MRREPERGASVLRPRHRCAWIPGQCYGDLRGGHSSDASRARMQTDCTNGSQRACNTSKQQRAAVPKETPSESPTSAAGHHEAAAHRASLPHIEVGCSSVSQPAWNASRHTPRRQYPERRRRCGCPNPRQAQRDTLQRQLIAHRSHTWTWVAPTSANGHATHPGTNQRQRLERHVR